MVMVEEEEELGGGGAGEDGGDGRRWCYSYSRGGGDGGEQIYALKSMETINHTQLYWCVHSKNFWQSSDNGE